MGLHVGRKCLMAFSIGLIISSVHANKPTTPITVDNPDCNIKPTIISCEKNKLEYSVVVKDSRGDKIVFKHNIERIPAPVPTRAGRRRMPADDEDWNEQVGSFFPVWKEKTRALKEKLALVIAKRRAQLRRQRKRVNNALPLVR